MVRIRSAVSTREILEQDGHAVQRLPGIPVRVQTPGLPQRVGIDLDHRAQKRVDAFDPVQGSSG